jgi:hypothetical protein
MPFPCHLPKKLHKKANRCPGLLLRPRAITLTSQKKKPDDEAALAKARERSHNGDQ